jgi:hypothetical protein
LEEKQPKELFRIKIKGNRQEDIIEGLDSDIELEDALLD